MKHKKLKELEKSFESGLLSKEEYESKKKEILDTPEEEQPKEEEEEKKEEPKLKSDKVLIIGAAVIILIFASFFVLTYFTQEETPTTIEELHDLNIKGKLDPEEGYMYNDAYSFVRYGNLWYTQLVSPQGSRLYNIQFRYGPRELEDFPLAGTLDLEKFNNATEYYVTFNPTGQNFSAMALAAGDFNEQMTKIFFKQPIAACDRNETDACISRPIINCDNTEKIVLYINESETTGVEYQDNCILVQGQGFDLVKGVDKVLLDFYNLN